MADVDRAINHILTEEKFEEEQANRISYYEHAKSQLKATLKTIDEEEEKANSELTDLYERYGIMNWSFDSIFEFQKRRKKAWRDYGAFLQTEKASLDQAKQDLMERQESAEKLEKMRTAEGYLAVALDEWQSVQPVQIPSKLRLPSSSVTVYPEEESLGASSSKEAGKPKRLNILGDIVDRVKRDMFEWKQKGGQRAKDHASGKDAHDYIETARAKNNAIRSLYHKVKQH